MLPDWMRRFWTKKPAAEALRELRAIAETMPLLQGLSRDEMDRLLEIAARLAADKGYTTLEDMPLSRDMLATLALQMALPVLNLGPKALADWLEVILYPAPFVVRDRWMDGSGLAHEHERVLVGQANYTGPLVLSWPDVAESPHLDGWNVVIHEIAHQLDMLNGSANGSPPLHKGMSQETWSREWSAAYQAFCDEVDAGRGSWLDPYAAENPAEFFAVLSEAFFEIPHTLNDDYPQLYQQLRLFYRQDPAARLPVLPPPEAYDPEFS
ncbi:phosphoenolpyruvate--glucose-phosphotransferase regulator [Xenophilus sp. AP218F]|nr:M90 family metallopeptidase [Chromobacterium sp. ASV5]OWY37477.1 phosphoenolpyruvate--glucose-phosphotransferase regulator [Xenophilus sp. AP218F]